MKKLYDEMRAEAERLFPDRKFIGGEGCVTPRLVLVGEAPGGDEEKQGRPFVGKAGKNLQDFLNILELSREEIYITNVVKLRPFKVNPKTGRISNRPPDRAEVAFFTPYLHRELKLLSPEIVVTLGNFALKAVSGEKNSTIGEFHGKEINLEGFRLFPLYHPASIIYNPPLRQIYEKDLEKLKEIIK